MCLEGEHVMPQSSRLIISSCIGGIVGVVLVRAFFLDRVEEIGWRIFWEGFGNGRTMDFGVVVQSATFAKCLAGLVIGGAAAMICAWRWYPEVVQRTQESIRTGEESHPTS
jgi:hypothetical protein